MLVAAFVSSVAVPVVVVGVLVAGLGGLVVAVGLAAVVGAAAYAWSPTLALTLTRARPADPVEHARLHNVVEGLCLSWGLPKPGVHVVDDHAPGAFTVGRGSRSATLVVTTGLVTTLTAIELEAVVAHELSHVKSGDVLVATLAVTMVALPSLALLLPAPVASRLVGRFLGPGREAEADVTGVSVTRYPPALISALEKLREGPAPVRSSSRATAHLWINSRAPMGARDSPDRSEAALEAAPSLEQRIEALREL